MTGGVPALTDELESGRGDRIGAENEARILAATQKPPPKPQTHRTSRRLGKKLGYSRATIARVWRQAEIKPQRLEQYTASLIPDFEPRAANIIGLYLDPPANAAVFYVDETAAIRAFH